MPNNERKPEQQDTITRMNHTASVGDHLYEATVLRRKAQEKHRQEEKAKKQKDEMQECTFKPNFVSKKFQHQSRTGASFFERN